MDLSLSAALTSLLLVGVGQNVSPLASSWYCEFVSFICLDRFSTGVPRAVWFVGCGW